MSDASIKERANSLLRSGDPSAAYQAYILASLQGNKTSDVAIGLALCLEKMGEFSRAVAQWRRIAEAHPKDFSEIHRLHLANCLLQDGKISEAEKLLAYSTQMAEDQGMKLKIIENLVAAKRPPSFGADSSRETIILQSASLNHDGDPGKADTPRTNYWDDISINNASANQLKFNSIYLVTYGRTGSTLLQSVLNSCEGILLLGENEGAFYHLFEYVQKIERLSKRRNVEFPTAPYFGANLLDPGTARHMVRQTIKEYFVAPTAGQEIECIGFKDVRYTDNPNQLTEYLEFLEDMLPRPAFIFLWRDHSEVLRSGWWKELDRVDALDLLEKVEALAAEFSSARDNCFSLSYADMVARNGQFMRLFEFLGANYKSEIVEDIFNVPHSYSPETMSIRELFTKYDTP